MRMKLLMKVVKTICSIGYSLAAWMLALNIGAPGRRVRAFPLHLCSRRNDYLELAISEHIT